jgi:hypothetical protein
MSFLRAPATLQMFRSTMKLSWAVDTSPFMEKYLLELHPPRDTQARVRNPAKFICTTNG